MEYSNDAKPTMKSDATPFVAQIKELVDQARQGVSDETAVSCLAVAAAHLICNSEMFEQNPRFHSSTLRKMVEATHSADHPGIVFALSAEQQRRIKSAPTPEADAARPHAAEADAYKLTALKTLALTIKDPDRCNALQWALAIAVAESGSLEMRFKHLVLAMDTFDDELCNEEEGRPGAMHAAAQYEFERHRGTA